MRRRTRIYAAAGAIGIVAAGIGTAAVGAASSDDQEPPISEPDLSRASRAALEHTGEGRVTETEVGDEDSYYEVEVTLDDGSRVDVQLDEQFRVVDSESDDDSGDDDD